MPQEMRFAPLFSGSSGNSIYIGCGNTHILTDAGMSGSRITAELAKIGVTPDMLSGIIATHEHSDHIKGVGILSRKYDLPIYATEGTWQGMDKLIGAVSAKNRRVLTPEQDFYIGDLNVTPFATPHDANEPIGLSFACGCARFSIATDIGCVRAGWCAGQRFAPSRAPFARARGCFLGRRLAHDRVSPGERLIRW